MGSTQPRRLGIGRGLRVRSHNRDNENANCVGLTAGIEEDKITQVIYPSVVEESRNFALTTQSDFYENQNQLEGSFLTRPEEEHPSPIPILETNETFDQNRPVEIETPQFADSEKIKDLKNSEKCSVIVIPRGNHGRKDSSSDIQDLRKATLAKFLRTTLHKPGLNEPPGFERKDSNSNENAVLGREKVLEEYIPERMLPKGGIPEVTTTSIDSEPNLNNENNRPVRHYAAIPPPGFINILPAQEVIYDKQLLERTSQTTLPRACSDTYTKKCGGKLREFSKAEREFKDLNYISSRSTDCVKKKRCYKVGEWSNFFIKNFSVSQNKAVRLWIADDDSAEKLKNLLNLCSKNQLHPPLRFKTGTAALVSHGNKWIRIIILKPSETEADVQNLDTGDVFRVQLEQIFSMPKVLQQIAPLGFKVIVNEDRLRDIDQFVLALKKAKQEQSAVEGCPVTWDFVPEFVFRLPGCKTLCLSRKPNTPSFIKNIPERGVIVQKLYRDLPGVELPPEGSFVQQCFVLHVEGQTAYVTWDKLYNSEVDNTLSSGIPFSLTPGSVCLYQSETKNEMRCYIDEIHQDKAQIRWIDCGEKMEVPLDKLKPLPPSHCRPPTVAKVILSSKIDSEDLSKVMLFLADLQMVVLDSRAVPHVLLFTENFLEVNSENLRKMKQAAKLGEVPESEAMPNGEEVFVVGVTSFSQIWVVSENRMHELEQLDAKLSSLELAPLTKVANGAMCAVENNGRMQRSIVRVQIEKSYFVQFVDRACGKIVDKVFELPEEFQNIESPAYCVSLCKEQQEKMKFYQLIAMFEKEPRVRISPTNSGTSKSSYFFATRENVDLSEACNL